MTPTRRGLDTPEAGRTLTLEALTSALRSAFGDFCLLDEGGEMLWGTGPKPEPLEAFDPSSAESLRPLRVGEGLYAVRFSYCGKPYLVVKRGIPSSDQLELLRTLGLICDRCASADLEEDLQRVRLQLSLTSYRLQALAEVVGSIFEPMPMEFFGRFLAESIRENLFTHRISVLEAKGDELKPLFGERIEVSPEGFFREEILPPYPVLVDQGARKLSRRNLEELTLLGFNVVLPLASPRKKLFCLMGRETPLSEEELSFLRVMGILASKALQIASIQEEMELHIKELSHKVFSLKGSYEATKQMIGMYYPEELNDALLDCMSELAQSSRSLLAILDEGGYVLWSRRSYSEGIRRLKARLRGGSPIPARSFPWTISDRPTIERLYEALGREVLESELPIGDVERAFVAGDEVVRAILLLGPSVASKDYLDEEVAHIALSAYLSVSQRNRLTEEIKRQRDRAERLIEKLKLVREVSNLLHQISREENLRHALETFVFDYMGLASRVLMLRKPIPLRVEFAEREIKPHFVKNRRSKIALWIPLVSSMRLVGLLVVDRSQEGLLDEDAIECLSTVATMASTKLSEIRARRFLEENPTVDLKRVLLEEIRGSMEVLKALGVEGALWIGRGSLPPEAQPEKRIDMGKTSIAVIPSDPELDELIGSSGWRKIELWELEMAELGLCLPTPTP